MKIKLPISVNSLPNVPINSLTGLNGTGITSVLIL